MMCKIFLLFFSIIPIFISIHCSKNNNFDTEITVVDGTELVSNPSNPQNGLSEYILEEDLTIGLSDGEGNFLFNRVSDIDVDRSGNIYVVDSGNTRIQVYDSSGHYVQTIGQKGQGPGEFDFLEQIDLGLNKKICTYDGNSHRISIFSTNGSLIKDFLITEYQGLQGFVYWVSNKKIITMFQMTNEQQKPYQKLVQYDMESDQINDLAELHDIPDDRKREGTKLTLYANCPRMIWNANQTGDVYVGLSNKYEISVYSSGGTLKRIIKRKYQPVKVPEETKKNISETFAKNRNKIPTMLQVEMKSYDYFPVFYNFLFDSKNYLWVEIHSDDKNINHIYDIFDQNGIYISQIKLASQPQVITHKYIYSIQRDKNGTNLIKRFQYKRK
jgi:hypothetical protein